MAGYEVSRVKRILVLILCSSCADQSDVAPSNTISFAEVTTEIAPTVCGNPNPVTILEVNGTGLALIDFDNDNDLDLFIANASGEPCRLYENVGDGTIAYKDVSEQVGIGLNQWATGVTVGDANGDGFDDLYITCHGQNVMLFNIEGNSFVDVTEAAGVADAGWGTSSRFGDLDGDGDLDLYVCNYLEFDRDRPPPKAKYKGQDVLGGPHGMTPQQDVVYENVGNGTFANVTEEWGFIQTPAFSLNATILDFNGDGLQDVFVGNDSMANSLFLNTGEVPTRFINNGVQSGIAVNGDGSMQATMGIAIADINGNGRPDVFTTNFSSDTNTLHINDHSGYFDDRTSRFGVGLSSRSVLGWSCGFHDFDLDGDEDLFIVNGHVYPNASVATMDSSRKQPVLLYTRTGNRFVQTELQGEFRDRAAVFGDLDNDGDIDIIVAQRDGDVRVLQNEATPNSMLSIALEGAYGNLRALGASMTCTFADGTSSSYWNTDGAGFQSSHTPNPIVIPSHKNIVLLDITWPSGAKQVVTEFPVNGRVVIQQSK